MKKYITLNVFCAIIFYSQFCYAQFDQNKAAKTIATSSGSGPYLINPEISYNLSDDNNMSVSTKGPSGGNQVAASITWTGGTSTAWTTASNWSTSTVPTNSDDVTIPSGTTFSPVMGNNVVYHARNLTINVGATLTFSTSGASAYFDIYGDVTVNGTLSHTGTKYIFMNKVGGTLSAAGNVSTCHIYFWSASTTTIGTNVNIAEIYIYNSVGTSLSLSSYTLTATSAINQYGTLNLNTGVFQDQIFSQVLTPARLNHSTGTFWWDLIGKAASGIWNLYDNDYYNVTFRCDAGYYISLDAGSLTDLTMAGSLTIYASSNLYDDCPNCFPLANTTPVPIYLNGVGSASNWVNNGTFTATTGTVTFNGSGATTQSLGGSSNTTFYNLTVNNSGSGGVVQSKAATVSNQYNAQAGKFDLNSLTLTVTNTATTGIVQTSGYVLSEQTNNSGQITWTGGSTATGAHLFPFGNAAGVYIPFTFNVTTASAGNVTLSTYKTNQANSPLPSSPQVVANLNSTTGLSCSFGGGNNNCDATVDRFWQITVSATPTATLIFGFDANAGSGTGEMEAAPYNVVSAQRAQRYDVGTSKWQPALAGQTTGTTGGYNWVQVPGVTTFSPWAVASNLSPLPVELTSLTALLNGGVTFVNWATASETNSDYFTIEKTKDGQNFEFVAKVNGAGNSNSINRYQTIDLQPYPGISYYRLKQTDFDGKYKYSELVAINNAEIDENSFTVYPNPATGELNVLFNSSSSTRVTVNVYDITGKLVMSNQSSAAEGNNQVKLDLSGVERGTYFVNLQTDYKSLNKRLVKQ